MVNLEVNENYLLKLGESEPINSIYLGIKKYKGNRLKHVFLVDTLAYRSFNEHRFYIGNLDDVTFKEGKVYMKNPVFKKINSLEKKFLTPLINKLNNQ